MPAIIDKDGCNLCGICYDICPQDIFSFDGKSPPDVVYPEECWHCGACVLDCPVDAVRLRLPLQMHIVPSPANFAEPGKPASGALRTAAAFSRSKIAE
jgi:adenylylsulfate reductase subunit B